MKTSKLDDPIFRQKALELWHNPSLHNKVVSKELWVSTATLYEQLWHRPAKPPKYSDEYIIERYKALGSIKLVHKELEIWERLISRLVHEKGIKVQKSAWAKPRETKKPQIEERQLNTFRWEYKQDDDYWKRKWFEIRQMSYLKSPVIH